MNPDPLVDLSDDELTDRLLQRGRPTAVAAELVACRDDPEIATRIRRLLGLENQCP